MGWWEEYLRSYPELRTTCDLLDTIDIYPLITNGVSIGNLMDKVEDNYDYPLNYKPFEGFLFNHMGEEDFMNYLSYRYGTRYTEIIHLYVTNPGKDDKVR